MRLSAEKLRWFLVGGALLLAVVLAALFGLANYRAGKVWQRILARNGVNLRRESNGITWSQSKGGRTEFTLHASRATPRGPGKWALHDAMLILYGRSAGHADRIYGSDFEYDEKTGVARALGDVDMDLQAPRPTGTEAEAGKAPDLSFKPGDTAGDPTVLHVRTSGLVYVRELDTASTDQPSEFRYKGLTCTSRGAEFDAGNSVVRLRADVHLNGMLRGEPFGLRAASATLTRETYIADLVSPEWTSGDREAQATHAVLHLRKDGSLETGEAEGDARLREGTRTVAAPRLAGVFDEGSRPQHARFSGGVVFAEQSKGRPVGGSAQRVELGFTSGNLDTIVAGGLVNGTAKEMSPGGVVLVTRRVSAATATAKLGVSGKTTALQRLHLTGLATFGSIAAPRAPGEKPVTTELDGDEVTTTFAAGAGRGTEPQHLSGVGHTRLARTGAAGERQESTGETLEVDFAEANRPGATAGAPEAGISSAVQSGHVTLHSWPSPGGTAAQPPERTGLADTATYDTTQNTLTLAANRGDRAEVSDGQTELLAERIVLHQDTGDSEATAGVAISSIGTGGRPASHVLAARARLHHATDVSEFFGTELEPAQLFEGGSQVEAAAITVDGNRHTLSARPAGPSGRVQAVFAGERKQKISSHHVDSSARSRSREGGLQGDVASEADREAVRVSASRMDFNDLEHEATFVGDVVMRGAMSEVRAQRGVAFLKAGVNKTDPGSSQRQSSRTDGMAGTQLGGTLDRLVMLGDVTVRQTGRLGSGEQLTYSAETNSFTLTGKTGKPPQMTDGQGGVVTGATLLFGASDSSIVVAGADGKVAGPARVHLETDVKQQQPKQP